MHLPFIVFERSLDLSRKFSVSNNLLHSFVIEIQVCDVGLRLNLFLGKNLLECPNSFICWELANQDVVLWLIALSCDSAKHLINRVAFDFRIIDDAWIAITVLLILNVKAHCAFFTRPNNKIVFLL